MKEPEALLDVARAAHRRGRLNEARHLHLSILSLYPHTVEAEEAMRYLREVERAEPQRVEQETSLAENAITRVPRRG